MRKEKTVKAITGLALGVTAVVTTATVQADELATPSETPSTEATVNVETTSQTGFQEVPGVTVSKGTAIVTETPTQETVDQAAAIKAQADSSVNEQQAVVDTATANEQTTAQSEATAKENLDQAQEIKDTATPENIAAQEKAVTNTQSAISEKQAQADAAKQATTDAQAEADKQAEKVAQEQTAIDNQQTNVDNAQKTVSNAQKNLDGTGAKEIIAERDSAQADLTAKEKAEKDAQDALKQAQEADAKKAADLAKAQADEKTQADAANKTATALTNAQNKANQTATDLANANTAVDNAQAALDGTGADKVIKERDDAQADVTSKQNARDNAQTALDNAQKADAKNASDIQALTTQEQAQITAANTAKAELDSATAVAADAKAKKDESDKAVKRLEDQIAEMKSLSTIEVPSSVAAAYREFVTTVKDGKPKTSSQRDDDKDALYDAIDEWRQNWSSSAVTPIDNTVVDTANITEKQIQDLSLYQAYLTQKMRESIWGTDKGIQVLVTDQIVKATKQIVTNYTSEGAPSNGHNYNALKNDGQPNVHFQDENIGLGSAKTTTMTDLYTSIYKSLRNTWRTDYNQDYAHVATSAGTPSNKVDGTYNPVYVGKGVSYNNNVMRSHEIYFTETPGTGTVISNPYDTTSLKTQLTTAKTAQANAESINTSAQNRLTTATVANTSAQKALSQTRNRLAELRAQADQTPGAQANLQAAITALQNAQTRLANAQKAVDNLNADIQTKRQALEDAKTSQAQALSADEIAKAELIQAQTANTSAQDELAKTRELIANLNAQANQAPAARIALTNATTAREVAQTRLDNAQKAVDNLNADIQTKRQALEDAQAKLQAEETTLATFKAQKEADQTELDRLNTIVGNAKATEAKIATEITTLQTSLKATQEYLDKLTHADENLSKAKEAYEMAVSAHSKAQEILAKETKILNQLLLNQGDANAQYTAVKDAYTQAQIKAQHDEIIKQGGIPVAVYDENGNIVGYRANHGLPVKEVVQAVVSDVMTRHGVPTYPAKLPATGDQAIAVYSLMGFATLGMAGVLGKRRNKLGVNK